MSTWLSGNKPLTFPAFWEWLKDHANCIVGASWGPGALFDDDALHWVLSDQEDRRAIVQVIKGKNLVGELLIDGREIDEVEVLPDSENVQSGQFVAELLSSAADGRQSMGHIVLAHGVEDTLGHPELRH